MELIIPDVEQLCEILEYDILHYVVDETSAYELVRLN
jgi:hypothetical protein